jgi:hypothetical protein
MSWPTKHWNNLKQNYQNAEYFGLYKDIFKDFYLTCDEQYLSVINRKLIEIINDILGITTKIRLSSEFELIDGQTEKLIGICKQCNADIYLSGPAAKEYFDEELAKEANIKVEWMDYSGYNEYKQMHEPFEPGVSILDLIFNEGSNANKLMKSFT